MSSKPRTTTVSDIFFLQMLSQKLLPCTSISSAQLRYSYFGDSLIFYDTVLMNVLYYDFNDFNAVILFT
jgi:hypothetical protein